MKADHTEQIKEKLTKEITIQILHKKPSWFFYPHSAIEQANGIAQDVRKVIDDILLDKEIVPKTPPVLYEFEWTDDYRLSITETIEKPKNKMLERPISRFKGFTD